MTTITALCCVITSIFFLENHQWVALHSNRRTNLPGVYVVGKIWVLILNLFLSLCYPFVSLRSSNSFTGENQLCYLHLVHEDSGAFWKCNSVLGILLLWSMIALALMMIWTMLLCSMYICRLFKSLTIIQSQFYMVYFLRFLMMPCLIISDAFQYIV